MTCTPSARLEGLFPDSSSDFAREGTLAHAIGEVQLRAFYKLQDMDVLARELQLLVNSPMYNLDMQAYVDEYVAYVVEQFEAAKKITKDAVISIERKLNLTDYIPESFGTGDAIIISDQTLTIIDLKYGKGVRVSADSNKQMMLYALGALREFDMLYDIEEVVMTVYQPRMDNVSSFVMKVSDLKHWADTELKPKAKMAFDGAGEFIAGNHCGFCRAKVTCKALADEAMKMARYEFADAVLLNDEEIADILTKVELFKSWATSIQEYAFKEALAGKKWSGFKLVEGRSNRCYSDQSLVELVLSQKGYPEELTHRKTLKPIGEMEKVLSKKSFEEVLTKGGLILKPTGKPTLVPSTDKRVEWSSVASAVNDFTEIEEDIL
jgi:hypothetical protein